MMDVDAQLSLFALGSTALTWALLLLGGLFGIATAYSLVEHDPKKMPIASTIITTLVWHRMSPVHMIFRRLSEIPSSAADVTPKRIQTCLKRSGRLPPGVTVSSVVVSPCGVNDSGDPKGLLSEISKLTCTYQGEGVPKDLPTTFVMKVSPDGFGGRMFGRLCLFENEYVFYANNIGGHAGFPTATCYFANYSGLTGEIVLLLEDLSGLDNIGAAVGLTRQEAKSLLTSCAKLHAAYWDVNPATSTPDISRIWSMADPKLQDLFGDFVKKNAEVVQPLVKENIGWEVSAEYVSLLVDVFKPNTDVIKDTGFFSLDRPMTVCFGDCRSDNMFFRQDRSLPPIAVDFQVSLNTFGAFDVAYSAVWNIPALIKENPAVEIEMLQHYHNELIKTDPSLKETYSFAQLGHDYVMGAAYTAYMNTVGIVDAINDFKKNKPVMCIWYEGLDAQLTRWNAKAVLRQGLSRVKKDSSGKTTMSPITDAERLAVLPEFFQKYVEAREAAAAPLDLSEITSIMG